MCRIMNDLCINDEIILLILSPCPTMTGNHDLSSGQIMADRDLSRYRIMANYILTQQGCIICRRHNDKKNGIYIRFLCQILGAY